MSEDTSKPPDPEVRSLVEEAATTEFFTHTVGKTVENEIQRVFRRYRSFALVVLVLIAALVGWKFYDLYVLREQLEKVTTEVQSQLEQVKEARERIVASRERIGEIERDLNEVVAGQKAQQGKISLELRLEAGRVTDLRSDTTSLRQSVVAITQTSNSNIAALADTAELLVMQGNSSLQTIQNYSIEARKTVDKAVENAQDQITKALANVTAASTLLEKVEKAYGKYEVTELERPTLASVGADVAELKAFRNGIDGVIGTKVAAQLQGQIPSRRTVVDWVAEDLHLLEQLGSNVTNDPQFRELAITSLKTILRDPKEAEVRKALLSAFKDTLPKKVRTALEAALLENGAE